MHSTNQTKIADLPIAANKILANSHTDHKPLSFKTHTPTDKGRRKRTKQFCKEKTVQRVFVLRRIISQTLLGNSTSQENLSCIFKKNRKKKKTMFVQSSIFLLWDKTVIYQTQTFSLQSGETDYICAYIVMSASVQYSKTAFILAVRLMIKP